jgi:hypothetical protein
VLRGLKRTLSHQGCELLCCEIHPTVLPPNVTVDRIVEYAQRLGFSRFDLPPRSAQMHMVARKVTMGLAGTYRDEAE